MHVLHDMVHGAVTGPHMQPIFLTCELNIFAMGWTMPVRCMWLSHDSTPLLSMQPTRQTALPLDTAYSPPGKVYAECSPVWIGLTLGSSTLTIHCHCQCLRRSSAALLFYFNKLQSFRDGCISKFGVRIFFMPHLSLLVLPQSCDIVCIRVYVPCQCA